MLKKDNTEFGPTFLNSGAIGPYSDPSKYEVESVLRGNVPDLGQIEPSVQAYELFRGEQDGPLKVGVYGDELETKLQDPDVFSVKYRIPEGNLMVPYLIDSASLEWYNPSTLRAEFPNATQYLYYAHPPIPIDDSGIDQMRSVFADQLQRGAVIFTDQYADEDGQPVNNTLQMLGQGFTEHPLGVGDTRKGAEVFAGELCFNGQEYITKAPSIFQVYESAVQAGEIIEDPDNSVVLEAVIEGDDADRIWELYKVPFDKLSKDNPMLAGFDEDTLKEILKNPEIAKIVNKVDGVISTLMFFLQDFDQCPWFNRTFYKNNYPTYYETNNIFMFPGIVTDDNMRGNNYSENVINLALDLLQRRGSNVLVTFECTETSATYIPEIVSKVISAKDDMAITGLWDHETNNRTPISFLNYTAFCMDSIS
jgi:hypothetical protein